MTALFGWCAVAGLTGLVIWWVGRDEQPASADGMVHCLCFAGRTVLLQSPHGVELELDGDLCTLDEAIVYLAEVDAL